MAGTHLTLACEDVAAGTRFFRDVLALPTQEQGNHQTDVTLGTIVATLTRRESPAAPNSKQPHQVESPNLQAIVIEMMVMDVREAVYELRQRGATVLIDPVITDWDTESAFIAGPDGILVELYRPLAPEWPTCCTLPEVAGAMPNWGI